MHGGEAGVLTALELILARLKAHFDTSAGIEPRTLTLLGELFDTFGSSRIEPKTQKGWPLEEELSDYLMNLKNKKDGTPFKGMSDLLVSETNLTIFFHPVGL